MIDKQVTVLIADDDRHDVEILKEVLEDLLPSANIKDVPDSIACLRYIKTSAAPDFLFLDLNMPLKNGINCLKNIFNLELLPGTPIIIYSTSNNIRDIDEAYKHNAAFYIVKPPCYKMLSKLVNTALTSIEKLVGGRIDKAGFVLSERNHSQDRPPIAL